MGQPMQYEEHEEMIRRLKDRNERLGVDASKIEVRYEDLTIEAEVSAGKRVLPTLPNTAINAAQELMGWLRLCSTRRRRVRILDCFSGVIRPSRMTLVLESPGSGKSTFLRALSQKLDPSLKVSGKITYNGQKLNNHISQMVCAYVSQHDLHHAEMTVRETLEFSQRMLNAGDSLKKLKVDGATKKEASSLEEPEIYDTKTQYARERCEYIIKMLGLEECADTIIGDEMRRGISGGQKKRTTIGEMLVGLAQVFFMDDISTGLDSSTTFQTLKLLQQLTQNLDLTMVISLLQPPQETFELFDIFLLSDGVIAYHGPREEVLDFFESMGFRCPDRKNVPDFLQEVMSRMDQAQYWVGTKCEYQYVPVQKFSDSFKSYRVGWLLEEQLHTKYNQVNDSMDGLQQNFKVQKWEVFKACFSREILLMKKNSPVHVFKNIQITLLAFVIMTVFMRSEMKHQSIADGNRWLGAIFAGVVIVKFNGMDELSTMIKRLPIYYKQRELLYLPGWALLLSLTTLSLPMSLIETGLWTSLTYYTIGFAPSVVRFLQQFLAFFKVHQMSMSLFRFIAVVAKTQLVANMLGTATLVAVYILGGFVISKDDIQPWLVWGYWLSPMTYGQNAVAINEFLDSRWSMKDLGSHIPADTVGKAILRSRGMLTEQHWFWYCVAILLSFALLFNIFSILALEYLKAPRNSHSNRNACPRDIKKAIVADEEVTRGAPPSSSSMTIPFQPLTLTFKHISYYVDTPKKLIGNGSKEKRLQLLRDVSGTFRPGILTVLMGVTGAGKTTLLDVLAGRKTTGQIEGSINISGYPKKQEIFARVSGYCEQTDNHSAFLTIHESLWYSAWLRLPQHVDVSTRHIFINEVMELVELKQLKHSMVGLPGRNGLAAEARKRLAMAVELVSRPSILFMDEPTTGLDSRAAAIVMRTVKKTANIGCTIVCTIHQPSIEIFEAFDELLLMKKGGKIIYGGPLGHLSQDMVQYFEAIPGVPKIARGQNPATWMLEVTSPSMEHKLGIDFGTIFQDSSLYKRNMELVNEMSNEISDSAGLQCHSIYAKSFWTQCRSCFWKQHKSYWKNPEHNIIRFVITITMSVLFGIVFFGIGSKIQNEQDIFNIFGAMYGSAFFLGFANANILQPVVEMERIAFYRERAAGMYTSMLYAIAQVAIEVPYNLAQVLIFSAVTYSMIGFQFTIAKFFLFMLFVFLSFIYFTLFGMMTVALTPNQEIAALLSFLIFILWNIFSGFFIPQKMIPIWWRWCYWADPAAWTIYGLMASQLGDCTDLLHVVGRPEVTIKEFLKEYFGLQYNYLPVVVSVHVAIIVLFLFVFGFSIKNLNFQRR